MSPHDMEVHLIAVMIEALEFYAAEANYSVEGAPFKFKKGEPDFDMGRTARKALEKIRSATPPPHNGPHA